MFLQSLSEQHSLQQSMQQLSSQVHPWLDNKQISDTACLHEQDRAQDQTQSIVYMFSTQSVFQDETVHDQGGSKNLEKSSSNRTSILKRRGFVNSWAFYWTSCSKIIFANVTVWYMKQTSQNVSLYLKINIFPKVFKDILLELL